MEWGGRRHRHGHRGERPHAVKPEPWLVRSVQIRAMQTPSQVLVVGLLVGLHARTHAPASNCGIIPPCSFARFAATTPPSPEQPRRLGSAPSLISVEIMTADCPHAAAVANGVIPAYLVAERGGEGRKAEECEGMRRK